MRCYKSCVNDIFQSLLTLLRRGCPITLVCLDVKINLKMPRTKSKAALEGNVLIHPNKYGFSELTTVEIYGVFVEELDKSFDKNKGHFDQSFKESKEKNNNDQ